MNSPDKQELVNELEELRAQQHELEQDLVRAAEIAGNYYTAGYLRGCRDVKNGVDVATMNDPTEYISETLEEELEETRDEHEL